MIDVARLSSMRNRMSVPGPEVSGAHWRVDLVALDRHRVLRGWSRRELARRAHVDPKTLSTMFRSRRRPVLGTVLAVCGAVGLRLEDVIVFDGEGLDGERPAA